MQAASKPQPPPIPPAEYVRRLVEANRVEDARRYVKERLDQGDTSVEGWAKVLRPPVAKPSPYRPRSDFAADNAWLRENRKAFLGFWVALLNGELLDSDVALQPLIDRLAARGITQGALVVQVD
jgi:hypothetical protein